MIKIKYSIFGLFTFLSSIFVSAQDKYLFSPKGIAEVYITLDNGKTLDDIKRDDKINDNEYFEAEKLWATMVIKNSASSTYDAAELYNGKILIKGRGNTTWGVPKKPYSIDLINAAGEDNPQSLLGMSADEEWVLLAFWHDRSLMRIPLAFYLGRNMDGLEYSPRLQYVEVYINKEYRGIYCLSEKIKRGNERVDIKKLTDVADDQTEPRISGGYILERVPDDKLKKKIEVETQIQTGNRGIKLVFKYPKPKNVTNKQRMWIQNYLTEFENVLYGNNFKDEKNGYRKYINEDSFIDWYILHDLSKGTDNLFHASIFMHKDRDGKLNMSAPWDFDISFGNVNNDCYYEDELWVRKTHYFHRLFEDERFVRKLIDRYDELMPLFDKVPYILNLNYKQLEEAGCLEREYEKWPQILRDYRDKENNTTPTTTKGHVRWFKDWFESRKAWLYINLGQTDEECCERIQKVRPTIRVMDPEEFEMGGYSDVKVMRGYKYYWSDSRISTNENYSIDNDTEYWVQIEDKNKCKSLPSKIVIGGEEEEFDVPEEPQDPNSLIEQLNQDMFVVYRSSADVFRIMYKGSKSSSALVSLYSMQGALLQEFRYNTSAGINERDVHIQGVSKGIYILKHTEDNISITRKIVVN